MLNILDMLDEMIENAEQYGWSYVFMDDSFYIEYGVYRKNIARIIYNNANDTWVYGSYNVNEYGNVG